MSGERGWVPAGELLAGELIRTQQADAQVESLLTLADAPSPVYNLEVLGSHRYFVGGAEVLAHNSCKSTWPMVVMMGKPPVTRD